MMCQLVGHTNPSGASVSVRGHRRHLDRHGGCCAVVVAIMIIIRIIFISGSCPSA